MSDYERYKIVICKFCRRAIRHDTLTGRNMELIGDELHAPQRPRSQAHARERGYENAQRQRDTKLKRGG